MKYLLSSTRLIGLSLLCTPLAYSAVWSAAGGGTWNDPANWNTAYFPGGPGSPAAPAAEPSQIAGISNGTRVVDLSVPLGTTHDMRIDAGQGASSTTLNVNSGGSLNATNAGNTILTINEGGGNTNTNSATVNIFTGGTVNVGQIRMGRDTDGGTSTLTVAGGTLFMTGGGHFDMRTDSLASLGIFNMSGGSFSSGGNRNLFMGNFDSRLNFSGSADFDGSNLTLLTAGGQAGSTDQINVTGSGLLNVTFRAITASPSTTFAFNLDAGGAKAIDSLNQLDLAGATLNVNLGAYAGTAPIVLFNYDSLANSFGSSNTLPAGWEIDTAYNGGTQIALVNSIPEPTSSALALLALTLGGLSRRR